MSIAKCRDVTDVSRVKVQERQKKAVFINDARETYFRTRIDGCMIEGALASDWVVSKQKCGDIIVELKGKDVNHGVKQVTATVRFWTQQGLGNGRLAALIVCNQYPKISTTVQRAADSLARDYKAALHVVTQNYEYEFESVLSFRGPHKA